MMKSVIVVADSTCARIFSSDSARSALTEIETLMNPRGRLHEREITSDLPGKNKGHGGAGGHAFESRTAPKKHELNKNLTHKSPAEISQHLPSDYQH